MLNGKQDTFTFFTHRSKVMQDAYFS